MREGYRIVISVFRGTAAGRALTMMAAGRQCEAPTVARANELVDEFLDAASAVLVGIDPGISLGVINVVDLAAGTVPRVELLRSR